MSEPIPPSAIDWNNLFNLSAFIAVAAMTIVIVAMIFFVIKYRERKGQLKFIPQIGLSRSRSRETVIFATISIILLLSLSISSYRLTPNARFPPPVSQSLVVNVTAYQWSFKFDYPNGVSTTGEVFLPANKNIIFNVTSNDVMHNFGLPDFRLKIDAIPGRYNVIWISTPSLNGNSVLNYTVRCYELCGAGHGYMIAQMKVMDPTAFNQWLNSQKVSNATTSGG
jgi:cytochrome c oxidase subunit 2